jgi:DNA-binding CsgD family transcriptional regulator
VGERDGAIAAVLLHKVALDLRSPPEAIAGLYGLTPGEVGVLLAMVEVGGVRETAEALGIGEATAKTHLHRLFGKTGATRQADRACAVLTRHRQVDEGRVVTGAVASSDACTRGIAHHFCALPDGCTSEADAAPRAPLARAASASLSAWKPSATNFVWLSPFWPKPKCGAFLDLASGSD